MSYYKVYLIPLFGKKNKNIARERIFFPFIANQSAQAIVTLALVVTGSVNEISVAIRKKNIHLRISD